jgi:hypothetical protein
MVTDGSKAVIRHHGVREALSDPKEVEKKLGDTILVGDKSAQSHNVEQHFGTSHRGKTDVKHRQVPQGKNTFLFTFPLFFVR